MIISDSTTLIILLDLDRMELLSNLFSKIIIPSTVYREILYKNNPVLPDFIEVISVEPEELLDELLQLLDKGESEAIVLAKQKNLPLIIDEKKGRKIALNLKINIIGLLGLVYLNIKNNSISVSEAKYFLNTAIKQGYRINQQLIDDMFLRL